MGKSWTELRAGELKGAEQRFWAALFGHAEEITKRINTDPDFTERLGGMVVRYHKKTLATKKAMAAEREKVVTYYKVADCFPKPLFYHRDSNLDAWLPATLPNMPAGKPTHLITNEGETFRQMAERELGVVGQNKAHQELMKLLVEKGKTSSLKQIEKTVVRHQAGDKSFGLCDDNWANFFFVEGADGAVFVVGVRLDSDGWRAYVRRFGRSDRWTAGSRVFFRN